MKFDLSIIWPEKFSTGETRYGVLVEKSLHGSYEDALEHALTVAEASDVYPDSVLITDQTDYSAE